ncbi:MAG: hypothetical protein R2822_10205 [Spirosomataceae bacterium]
MGETASGRGIGNNPFVMAVPRKRRSFGTRHGDVSIFIWKTSNVHVLKTQKLPYPGGFDEEGTLTDDPSAIEATQQFYLWVLEEGSGFAVMLDMFLPCFRGAYYRWSGSN